MATDGFQRALERVLVHEGGFSDHPRDPGGSTFQGVTQAVYSAYRRNKQRSVQTVLFMTASERDEIYRAQYWEATKCNRLPPGVDYVVFDGSVNSGPSQSAKWLQRALGPLYRSRVDGIVGQATLAAVARHTNHDMLIRDICAQRLDFLRHLKTWNTFGKGWRVRVSDVEETGQAWASGDVGPSVAFVEGAQVKALIADAKAAPVKGVADAAVGGGISAATIAQAIEQLAPLAVNNPVIANIVAFLTVAGVAATVGGLGYRMWATWRSQQRAEALSLEIAA